VLIKVETGRRVSWVLSEGNDDKYGRQLSQSLGHLQLQLHLHANPRWIQIWTNITIPYKLWTCNFHRTWEI